MANLEHLEILRQSIEEWNRWRIENRFKMIDLREADLIGAYLDSPPPAEDLRSERVNELRRLHTLSGTRAESQVEFDVLLPSVLDRAFKGEL